MFGDVTALEGVHVTGKYMDNALCAHALGMRPGILTGVHLGLRVRWRAGGLLDRTTRITRSRGVRAAEAEDWGGGD